MFVFFLILLGLLCLLLVVDFVLRHPFFIRLFYYGPSHYYYDRSPFIPKTMRHTPKVNVQAMVQGRLSYIQGVPVCDAPVRFVTDRWGYRNVVSNNDPLPNTVVLGNCFVSASKTAQEEILSEQLKRKGYQCYNISVDTINLWEEVVDLKYHLATNPFLREVKKVVWVIFEGNDVEGAYYPETEPGQLVVSRWKQMSVVVENYYKRSVLRRLCKMLFTKRERPRGVVVCRKFFHEEMYFFEPYVRLMERTDGDIQRHPNAQRIQELFSSLAGFASQRQLEILTVYVPVKSRVYEWVLRGGEPWTSSGQISPGARFVEDLCAHNGFSFLDLTAPLIQGAKKIFSEYGEVVFWRDDTHWNQEGIRIAVEQVEHVWRNRF